MLKGMTGVMEIEKQIEMNEIDHHLKSVISVKSLHNEKLLFLLKII